MFMIFMGSSLAAVTFLAALSGYIQPAWSGSDFAAAGLVVSGSMALGTAAALDV